MSTLVDTSVLIDVLRGNERARRVLAERRAEGILLASEMTRLEVFAGMRPTEESRTRRMLEALHWYPVDGEIAERAGELGRRWLPSHRGIDSADLAIAATALVTESRLLTMNVKHFPMFPELTRPY